MMLNNSLLPHQKEAVDKLIKLKVGALLMEQGTGKTITVLELARIRSERKKIMSVVWLCPCSAKGNIKREIVKQCPPEMLKIFTICGIETLSSSVRALSYLLQLSLKKKCFLVVDESLLVKNPRAYRTENILKLAAQCDYRMILNGTPVSKNEADLFSQFYILDWRILGYKSYWSFSANHIEYDRYDRFRRVLNTDYLTEKIAPYTYQITKDECVNLPNKRYSTYYFSLTKEQELKYDEAAFRLLDEMDELKPESIFRLFSGLQAVTCGKNLVFNRSGSHFETVEAFCDPEDNPRIQCVLGLLGDEKTIIFCRYESEIEQLCSLLPDAVRFDGEVSPKGRESALKEFAGEKKYLVANRNCAGFSLNLQFCHNIIYMSNDWDLGKRLQSEDRVHRMGQNHEVNVMDVCAEGTVDERILSCLSKKESLLNSIKDEIKKLGRIEALKKTIRGDSAYRAVFDCVELEELDA